MTIEELLERIEKQLGITEEPLIPEGWIPWHGGECPVQDDATVEVICFDDVRETGIAYGFSWDRRGRDSDIIAYRIVKETRHYPRGMAVEVEDPDLHEREEWYATGDGKFAPRNDLKHSISLTWPTRPAGFDPSKAPDGAKAMVFLNSGGRFWTTSPELHECNSEVEWIEYLPEARR